jgi:hypothetical protein
LTEKSDENNSGGVPNFAQFPEESKQQTVSVTQGAFKMYRKPGEFSISAENCYATSCRFRGIIFKL